MKDHDSKKIKFRDKYRLESMRLKKWDYPSEGMYFITICTKDRACSLSKVVNDELQETETSKICVKCWQDLSVIYPDCILDAFVVMPNHVHGIIMIEAAMTVFRNKQRRNMLISKMIGRFKMQTAKQINQYQNTRGQSFWQKNYYDRVIRNELELNRIREYIENNPARWRDDENYIK